MKKNKIQISRIALLNEIFLKASIDREKNPEVCLRESSLSFLITEKLDETDVKEVRSAIEKASKKVDEVFKYLDKLENFDRSKISTLDVYLGSMKDALNKAQGELANVNFKTGSVSKFFGEKMTLPQITQAAIGIQTKANDFFVGFSDAMDNIRNNLGPLVKNDKDQETALKDLAGTEGFPDEDNLRKGIQDAMKTALGGGFFKKIASFFTKSRAGAEKRILETLPDLDINAFSLEIADALMDSSIKALQSADPPKEPDEPNALEDEAKEAQKAEDEAPILDDTQDSEPSSGDEPPPLTSEKEAKLAQDTAAEELTAVIKDVGSDSAPPGVAVMDAIEAWYAGLSSSSQKTLSAAGRFDSLKDTIKTSMDNSATTIENEIKNAISDWRSSHEETLVKSRRFAKKNFDSLEKMIPQLASFMIKKVNESPQKLTRKTIRKHIFDVLNRKFQTDKTSILSEKYDQGDMEKYRLNKLAGLNK